LIGAGTTIFLTAFDGGESLLRGTLETKVHRAFYRTDSVTKVKAYRLGELVEESPAPTFPILPYGSVAKITGTTEIAGEELNQFKSLWRGMMPTYYAKSLCHAPVYAVEFFENERRVFRTSICWHCHNFYVEAFPGAATWYGFDAESPGAQKVLKFFESQLPLIPVPPTPPASHLDLAA